MQATRAEWLAHIRFQCLTNNLATAVIFGLRQQIVVSFPVCVSSQIRISPDSRLSGHYITVAFEALRVFIGSGCAAPQLLVEALATRLVAVMVAREIFRGARRAPRVVVRALADNIRGGAFR